MTTDRLTIAIAATKLVLHEFRAAYPALDLARMVETHPAPPASITAAYDEVVRAEAALRRAQEGLTLAEFHAGVDPDDYLRHPATHAV